MTMQVSVTGQVRAPAQEMYGLLRDYGHHHPEILPDIIKTLTVEEGGIGDGTLAVLEVDVFGKTQTMRMRVDEPGRVLRETDVNDGTMTTFTVEPDGDSRSTVTLESTWEPATGMAAIVDRGIKPRFMRRLYRQELQNLDEYARGLSESKVL